VTVAGRNALSLGAAAVLGGAVALGGGALLGVGGGDGTTTVVQQAPLARGTDGPDEGGGLTPAEIYERLSPGVVFIRAQIVEQVDTPFGFGPTEQRSEGTGTGFVIAEDGKVLTNAHVVAGASQVTVQFADERQVPAKLVGTDLSTDLALLKVDPEDAELEPLPLGSSKDVRVGDPTIAIGNPFGLDRTLTTGVVSALQRKIEAPDGFEITDVIQTDAAINPGNSGGPLIDASGQVVGVNSQILTGGQGSRGNVGIGFAVPIDTARRIVPELERSGRVERGYLGVGGLTVDERLEALDLPVDRGVLVQAVGPGTPAERAGLRGGTIQAQLGGEAIVLGGDVITEVDGRAVDTEEALTAAVTRKRAGQEVTITYVRGGKERTVKAKLARRPASQPVGAP
jgi:S1-C subfamily serine protease